MKFFTFMCCTAHLLTGITSRLRRTTPMTSEVHTTDAEGRQVAKFAEIINFVNSASNDYDGRRLFSRYNPFRRVISRRLQEVMATMHEVAGLKKFQDVTQPAPKRIENKVRYHVIDNPEVLMKFKAKQQKNNNVGENQENTSKDAFQFSTAVNKINDTTPEVTSTTNPNVTFISHDNATIPTKAEKNVQELNKNETANRRSLKNDEKPTKERKKLEKNEKNKVKKVEEDHDLNITDDFKKDHRHSSNKDKSQTDKKKIVLRDSKETVTKGEGSKKHRTTEIMYSQEKLKEDRKRPKDEADDKKIIEHVDTNENSGEDKKEKGKPGDINVNNLTSAERLILKVDNKINGKRDKKEQYSIYTHKETHEDSNKHSKKSHEHVDKYDKKKEDKYHDKNQKRESAWIKVEDQRDYKEILRDNGDEKWGKKERDWDENNGRWDKKEMDINHGRDIEDRWSKKEKDWESDDERLSKKDTDWGDIEDKFSKEEKYRDKNEGSKKDKNWERSDERLTKKEKYWDKSEDRTSKKDKNRHKINERSTKKEKYWNNKKRDDEDRKADTMEYEWNKRHQEYDEHENKKWEDNDSARNDKHIKERDIDFEKRDEKFNKRDDDWTKRESGRNVGRTGDRFESEDKKDGDARHDRYKIVERFDSGGSKNDGFERF